MEMPYFLHEGTPLIVKPLSFWDFKMCFIFSRLSHSTKYVTFHLPHKINMINYAKFSLYKVSYYHTLSK